MKFKAHTRYILPGTKTRVPGVTTVTGELGWNKQILINWASKKGLAGIDVNKFTDDKAEIGVLAHQIVTDSLFGKETDTDDYSKNQIKLARNSAKSWFNWARGKKIEPILIEEPLVSERLKYGGTPDIFARINGVYELIDLKTGSGVYNEMVIQVAAYQQLIFDVHGCEAENVRILNIPRTRGESFIEKDISTEMCGVAWEIFIHLLQIYKLKQELK